MKVTKVTRPAIGPGKTLGIPLETYLLRFAGLDET